MARKSKDDEIFLTYDECIRYLPKSPYKKQERTRTEEHISFIEFMNKVENNEYDSESNKQRDYGDINYVSTPLEEMLRRYNNIPDQFSMRDFKEMFDFIQNSKDVFFVKPEDKTKPEPLFEERDYNTLEELHNNPLIQIKELYHNKDKK